MARILVIDDNPELRTLLRVALTGAGHEVAEAAHGGEGLEQSRQRPCDLILCDMLMLEKEGFETIRELRELQPNIRIIAMSGGLPSASFDPLPIATLLGAKATLTKPFDIPTLLAAVNAALKKG